MGVLSLFLLHWLFLRLAGGLAVACLGDLVTVVVEAAVEADQKR